MTGHMISDTNDTGNEARDASRQEVSRYLPEAGAVTVLSATWCAHCIRLKTMLEHTGIPYREVLIEEDADAEQVAADANDGDWIIPTVLFADGSIRVHPGLTGVQERLAQLAEQH